MNVRQIQQLCHFPQNSAIFSQNSTIFSLSCTRLRVPPVALHLSQLISWIFIAFCRCSSGVAPHALKILVSHFSEGPKGGRRKGGRGRKLSHFSFCCAFRCCVVYSPCFPVWGEEKVMTIYDAGPLAAGPLCGLLNFSPPFPGGVPPKFGSEKASRYPGVSQVQLRVSRYTVQLSFQPECLEMAQCD